MDAATAQSLWDMVQGLQREVEGLQSENESLRTTVSALSTLQTNTPEPTTTRKTVMSDPFIFDVLNKSLFLQWRALMEEKLDVDGWRYPSEKDKIAYTSGRLGPDPAGHIKPWKDQH